MKKRMFVAAVVLAALCAGCDRKYSEPPHSYTPVELEDTISIARLKAMYPGKPDERKGNQLTIYDDLNIKGKVVSSDANGNFYNCIYIQDDASGMEIRIGRSGLFNYYPVGMIVSVRLKGMTLGAYGTQLSVGAGPYISPAGKPYENSDLAPNQWIETALVRGPVVPMESADTIRVEATSDRNDRNVGRLVRVKGTFYKNTTLDTWGDTDGYGEQYIYFGTNKAKHITIRTAGSATFARRPVAQFDGKQVYATGILTVYDGTYQLLLNSDENVEIIDNF